MVSRSREGFAKSVAARKKAHPTGGTKHRYVAPGRKSQKKKTEQREEDRLPKKEKWQIFQR